MMAFKDFRFSAAHFLPNVPEDHKCRRMHGHNYKVRVGVRGVFDEHAGWVMDFARIGAVAKPAIEALDHSLLNDVLDNPTAELLAIWLHAKLCTGLKLYEANVQIMVWETDDCGVVYP